MRKIVLIILFCFLPSITFAQPRIGQLLMQVKHDLSKYPTSSTTSSNGDVSLTVTRFDKKWVETHIFDKHGVCYGCITSPSNEKTANQLMKEYNSKYSYSRSNNRWIVTDTFSILHLYLSSDNEEDIRMFIHASNSYLNRIVKLLKEK
ncbi:hypothetical protein LJC45_03145 [Alistipes sp. OttesenSCG-928-B03]|nr:hypothetical protein [Alistipes sp. OttesenSCG-928-B03]